MTDNAFGSEGVALIMSAWGNRGEYWIWSVGECSPKHQQFMAGNDECEP